MLCTQIISEYERQTKLLERIVEELEKINARATLKSHRKNTEGESLPRTEIPKAGIKKRLLSVEETAAYIGISPRTLYNRISWKATNPFPVTPKRVGRRVKFDRDELDAYVDSL
jgi:predicted DNA-binding transcriptional regulator AlpA